MGRKVRVSLDTKKIREAAKRRGVPLWKVAHAAGIGEATLYRWLRDPSPAQMQQMQDGLDQAWKQVREEVLNCD